MFQPDPTIYDGSWANNGWLQELPKPITKLTWGNAAIMSPATAKQLGIGLGSYAHGGEHGGYYMPVVELQLDGRTLRAPAWIMPGHADRSVTVYLGHGRQHAGQDRRQRRAAGGLQRLSAAHGRPALVRLGTAGASRPATRSWWPARSSIT